MEAFFNSAKSDFLEEGELTFLKTMIRYARLQPVTVFRKKLLDPSPSFEASIVRNRQRYLLECLITIGSKQAVEAAQEFKQQYPDVDLEILRKADEVVLITFDSSAVTVFPAYQKESSMVGSDNLQQQQAVFQSTIEPGVQYILIKGGR